MLCTVKSICLKLLLVRETVWMKFQVVMDRQAGARKLT
jgi:hypothetical protein